MMAENKITSINPWNDYYTAADSVWATSSVDTRYLRTFSFTVNGKLCSVDNSVAKIMVAEHYQWTEMAKENESFAKQLEQLRVMFKLYSE